MIPDIHLKPWIFDRTEKILRDGKADRAVCLMDMPDDWNMEFQIERYKETFDRAIAFAEDYPDTLWCYGNHDVSYSWGRLETGYSPYAERTVMSKLEELENRLKSPVQINIMHRIDNVLFSHGGLTADFLRWLNKDLLDADIEEVIATVNDAPHDYLWNDKSPLWFRPQYETREMFRADTYKQVVGHTPVEKIFEKDGIISTDVFSTYRDGRQIGESAMKYSDGSIQDRIIKREVFFYEEDKDMNAHSFDYMSTYKTSIEGKIGRNDKCVCGSGKKYKKCCISKYEKAARILQDIYNQKNVDYTIPGARVVEDSILEYEGPQEKLKNKHDKDIIEKIIELSEKEEIRKKP